MLVLGFVDAAVLRVPHRLTAATTAGTVMLLAPVGAPAASWWSATISAATAAAALPSNRGRNGARSR